MGLTERSSDFSRTVLIPVNKRDSVTLSAIVANFVSNNCTMMCTDEWKGYYDLVKLGYNHKKIIIKRTLLNQSRNPIILKK